MEMELPTIKAGIGCPMNYVLAVNDTLNVINGKWKLPIIGSLLFEKKRFTEIQKNIGKITPRMLSKELKELEQQMAEDRARIQQEQAALMAQQQAAGMQPEGQ